MEMGLNKMNLAKKNFELLDFDAIRAQSILESEQQRQREKIAGKLAKIPLRFREKSFADFIAASVEQQQVKKTLEKFVTTFAERKNDGTCLQFLGTPGTGKTLLAFAIYRALTEADFDVHYEASTLFLKLLQEKRFESYAAFQAQLNFFVRQDLLILDEISESVNRDGSLAEFEKRLLFDVINARYEQQRSTLIISNRNQDSLANCLGASTVDRLTEQGISLVFNWQSYR